MWMLDSDALHSKDLPLFVSRRNIVSSVRWWNLNLIRFFVSYSWKKNKNIQLVVVCHYPARRNSAATWIICGSREYSWFVLLWANPQRVKNNYVMHACVLMAEPVWPGDNNAEFACDETEIYKMISYRGVSHNEWIPWIAIRKDLFLVHDIISTTYNNNVSYYSRNNWISFSIVY